MRYCNKYIFEGIFIILMLWGYDSKAQISPGELTYAHEKLEGMANCVQCHVLKAKVTNDKCLDCHTEIKSLIENNQGYHVSVEVNNKDCFVCHNEHHGRKFKIIHFDPDTFNHSLTGYDLLGKHADQKCIDCHKSEFIKEKTSQKSGDSYLDLSTNCSACHSDFHEGALGNDCASCHGFDAFRPALGFDHQKTDFPLIGIHARTDCTKCHKKQEKEGLTLQAFKHEKVNSCTDCHEDVHENKFGQDCLKCHNQESFHTVKNLDNFDHSTTNFPLAGKHQTVDCKECHKQSYTTKIKHSLCSDCHADYHKEQFTSINKQADCVNCHTTSGFTPAQYTIEQHNQTEFKLAGAHLATPCFACHLKAERWEFREIGKNCVDCHDNIHDNLIDPKFYPKQNCESCHSIASWDQVLFDHNLTNFKLEGQHATESCRNCHFQDNEDQSYTQQFSTLNNECTQCHIDVHYDQFKEKYQNLCTTCHAFNNWEPVKFEHDSTEFKLEGGHKAVACIECHLETTDGENKYFNYQFDDIKCANCHTP